MEQADTDEVVDFDEQPPEVVDGQDNENEQPPANPDGEQAAVPAATIEDDDEVTVTIGEEPPPQEDAERAPDWVRDLRKRNQETVRENRELKKQLDALKAVPAEKPVELGEKPTLASCDFDEEDFATKLEEWNERKRSAADQERKKHEAGAKAQAEWNEKVTAYQKEKADLKVSDKDDAEAVTFGELSVSQRGILLDAVSKPALVAIALGKNPKRLKELAAITNPIKFAIAVHDLEEKEMKVTPRKTAPLPETAVRGNARMGGVVGDSTLDRLRAEADRSGDRTKVAAYMRTQQKKRA